VDNLLEYTRTMLARIGFKPERRDEYPTDKEYFAAVKAFVEKLSVSAVNVYGKKAGGFVVDAFQALLTWSVIHGRGQTTLMAMPKDYRASVMEFMSNADVNMLVKNTPPILAAFTMRAIEYSGDVL